MKGNSKANNTCLVFIMLILFSMLFSCSGENQEIKNLIITYNKVLIDAYLKPKAHYMENFTSEKEFRQIDTYISYLYKTNRILKCDLKKIEFESIKITGQKATVSTKEMWLYLYLDSFNRTPVSEEYSVIYANVYSLIRGKGRWIVDDLESHEIGGKGEGNIDQNKLNEMHKGVDNFKTP